MFYNHISSPVNNHKNFAACSTITSHHLQTTTKTLQHVLQSHFITCKQPQKLCSMFYNHISSPVNNHKNFAACSTSHLITCKQPQKLCSMFYSHISSPVNNHKNFAACSTTTMKLLQQDKCLVVRTSSIGILQWFSMENASHERLNKVVAPCCSTNFSSQWFRSR